MVKVYQCKSWNDGEAKWKCNRGHFTGYAILQMSGTEIVPGTERDVDKSELDENARIILPDVGYGR